MHVDHHYLYLLVEGKKSMVVLIENILIDNSKYNTVSYL